jgi:CubicO group peptidase (beta-lactamase class C family)
MQSRGEIEQYIEEQMRAAHVPGLALALVQSLEVVYAQGFGVTGVEDGGLPVTPLTLFRIGSLTKALTCTAIMRLVEAGDLDLDRPVGEYVPSLTFSEEDASQRITLHMLLSHTAGLPTAHTPFGRRDVNGLEAYVREDVPRHPFVAPPAKLYAYSNPGFRIAGYVAQVVSGMPYARLMQELVFDPLEMKRTTFDLAVAMTYPLAQSHDLYDDGRLSVQHRYADDTSGYPSGAAFSTVQDLTHFALMQMNGGRFHDRQILSPQSVAEMQTAKVDMYTVSRAGYGLGLITDSYKGVRRVWHEGSISTFGSRLVMVPEAGAAVVLVFNRAPGFWARAEAVTDRLLDRMLDLPEIAPGPQAVEPDRSLWPLYTGSYLGDWRGLVVVETAGDRLTARWNGEALPLYAYRRDLYFGQRSDEDRTVSVGLVPESEGPAAYIQVNSSPCKRFQPDTRFVPAPETWQRYAGRYSGVEKLRIRVEGNRLYVYSAEVDKEMPCVALSNTLFACDVGLLEFHVAADGSVPSLQLGKVYTLNREK